MLLSTAEGRPGLFEQVLGFRTATTKLRAVHMMNDVAQCVLGGAPQSGGDFLARVMRFDKEGEGNQEQELRADERFGDRFNMAFPRDALGPRHVQRLREAIRLVADFDKGVYEPGTSMASPLATHVQLLGFEQYRRFRVGAFLTRILGDAGSERVRSLMTSDRDPTTRALRPLLANEPLVDKQPRPDTAAPLTPFDLALGMRLRTLLSHQFAKPTLLRYFALGATLGVVLKLFGAGREGGRPVLLALATERENGQRPLRAEAVQALRLGRDMFMNRVAELLAPELQQGKLAPRTAAAKETALEVRGSGVKAARELLEQLRERDGRAKEDDEKKGNWWWPDKFAVHLGRQAGCILPLSDRAGWGTHLALSPELIEILLLMEIAPNEGPTPWSSVWRSIRDDLGIIIGANATADAEALRDIGVAHVSPQQLRANANRMLAAAVRRGAARRLPDGGAEGVGTSA